MMSGTVLHIMVICGRFGACSRDMLLGFFSFYFYLHTNQQLDISIYVGERAEKGLSLISPSRVNFIFSVPVFSVSTGTVMTEGIPFLNSSLFHGTSDCF